MVKAKNKNAEPKPDSAKPVFGRRGRAVFIYTLSDPDTGAIRYVGKTIDPAMRYDQHISRSSESTTHRGRWVRKLLDAGKWPVMNIVEKTNRDRWVERERYWIDRLRYGGFRLTNTTSGGDGVVGMPLELELDRRRKVSAARMGMKFTPKHRANLSKRKIAYFRLHPESSEHLCRLWAKLTDAEVIEVWMLAKAGVLSQKAIGKAYQIPQSSVSEILYGKRYKHVQRPKAA